ncbi:MAG: ASKHA domain-containing protein [Smithella sp.]|nr:ASKHA domain-containing protein [Smithella sp.]
MAKLCKLTMLPGSATAEYANGTVLIDALEEVGVMLPSPCGGKGFCAKCLVKASGALSKPSESENRIIENHEGYRLACQARVEGDVHVSCEIKCDHDGRFRAVKKPDRAGLAVDIGTTSVQVSLKISQNESILLGDFLNPQRRYGHDVISRIAAAKNANAAIDMSRRIRNVIKSMALRSLEEMCFPTDIIDRIVISGNTTMLYLFFGINVAALGENPYRAEYKDINSFQPEDVGMKEFARAELKSMPIFSAFVGGDVVGGFSLSHIGSRKKNTFYIDLGTNGEIVFVNSIGEIRATSCAMGPALEGMNISCGMSAGDGAIIHARLDRDRLIYDMIGDGEPVGISGTALIDITALLLEVGGISCRGNISPLETVLPYPAQIVNGDKGKNIRIRGDIVLTQEDIRNLQLAKAASLAASQMLLEDSGCKAEEVEQVIISGALGRNLNIRNFKKLGFIPDFPNAEYKIAGNTSLEAAEHACSEDDFLRQAQMLRDRMSEVVLAGQDSFRRRFINALDFPHTCT